MGDYRRIGNAQQHMGNSTSVSLVHQLRDLWKSPRGTVLRIEALALVAIALSFFLATFGSCRRWSKHWILQKGFLVANALFLSLGTYSIGLMQSSSVKNEMYPVWAVSLLALLCCVDSVTTYSLDSNSQFWKMVYQLCLYVGYVLLMSISTISSDLQNIAVGVLSAITFIKGFHRTLALVLPGRIRSMIRAVPDCLQRTIDERSAQLMTECLLVVHLSLDNVEPRSITEDAMNWEPPGITLGLINSKLRYNDLGLDVDAFKDVCLSISLSHLLHRRFLGYNNVMEIRTHENSLVSSWILLERGDKSIDYEGAFKVVELELAFLYDVLFTSNAFLHYYEAKTASVWALASVVGICFVGVAVAIPGTTSTTHTPDSTVIVNTTTGDLIITGVILVSLALLQVLQLLRCWTSNWARVALACDCFRNNSNQKKGWQMRLRASLCKINWFHKYLWQNSLGQHSLIESISRTESKVSIKKFKRFLSPTYSRFSAMLGLQYFEQMLEQLWGNNSTGDAIDLHADVKASISDYLRRSQLHRVSLSDRRCLGVTYELDPEEEVGAPDDYVRHLLTWHIATCYCEVRCTDSERASVEKNHCVATALSKYLAHLVVSVPRLLPGRYVDYKNMYDQVSKKAGEVLQVEDKLGSMERAVQIGFLGHVKYRSCEIRRIIMEDSARLRGLMRATVNLENRSYEQIRDVMHLIGITVEASTEKISCEQGIERSMWAVWRRWAEEWEQNQEREIHLWQLLKDDLGTIMENRSGEMGMEEGREVLLQAKGEVLSAAMERERGIMKEGWLRVMDWLSSAGLSFMIVKEKLSALELECERIMEALGRAIDKLEETQKELHAERGTHQYDDVIGNPILGSRIFYSGMYLGGRLQLLPAPERWKRLADLWVKALVYAAPSDNVEEHMQQLAQGGEFITHVWAMLYHHGILRPEEAAGEDGRSHKQIKRGDGHDMWAPSASSPTVPPPPPPPLLPPDLLHTQTTFDHIHEEEDRRKTEKDY